MRILVATDAWEPQVNGVVRTLKCVAQAAKSFGVEFFFLTPKNFRTLPLPTYPDIRLAIPSMRIVEQQVARVCPDAFHIATEGPIGLMLRRYCRKRGIAFTTSFHTRFPIIFLPAFRFRGPGLGRGFGGFTTGVLPLWRQPPSFPPNFSRAVLRM
jgi:hypothetical protein